MANFTIKGINEIQKLFSSLPAKVQKKAARQAMRPAMKPLAADMKSRAPVDTGTMKKAIAVRAAPRSRKYIGVDVVIGDKKFENYYPKWVEYGTSKMPPQPFMRRTLDAGKDDARNKATEELLKIVKTEIEKG